MDKNIKSRTIYECCECGAESCDGFFVKIHNGNGTGKTIEFVSCKGQNPKDWNYYVDLPKCLGTLVSNEAAQIPNTI